MYLLHHQKISLLYTFPTIDPTPYIGICQLNKPYPYPLQAIQTSRLAMQIDVALSGKLTDDDDDDETLTETLTPCMAKSHQ